MIMNSFEEELERQEFKALIFNTAPPESALDWEDDDWVPPWFGTEDQNKKEAQAFAAWTRKTGGGD